MSWTMSFGRPMLDFSICFLRRGMSCWTCGGEEGGVGRLVSEARRWSLRGERGCGSKLDDGGDGGGVGSANGCTGRTGRV